MKSMFNAVDCSEIIKRIEDLKPGANRKWGKMEAAQMLAHCAEALRMANGELKLKRPFISYLIGKMVKNSFMGERPFKKNSPTSPVITITDSRHFEKEKQRLLVLAKQFHKGGEAGATSHPHAFFGPLTKKEWGELQWKHIDHHLQQFGA